MTSVDDDGLCQNKSGGQNDEPGLSSDTGLPTTAAGVATFVRRNRKHQPPEPIITEGNLQLKELARKQIQTDVTLKGQLAQVKSFSQGTIFAEPLDGLTGQISLNEYRRLMDESQGIEELRRCGLTDDEIAFKLERDALHPERAHGPVKRHYGVDPFADSERSKAIEEKIAEKDRQLSQPTTFAGARTLTRHEMELEHAVTHDRDPSKVFRCLLTNRSKDAVLDPDHPINHLDEIWKDVVSRNPPKTSRRRKRKRTKGPEADGKISETVDAVEVLKAAVNTSPVHCDNQLVALHDDDDADGGDDVAVATVEPKPPKPLDRDVEPIPVEVIERYRLSVDQIKQLPRFKDYSPGEPSPILYLKNLSPRVTEQDLVTLFIRFQVLDSPPIDFKLLRGRMKRQAFVTFDSADTASAALKLVNGYDFKGKPIIIEFGKKAVSGTGTGLQSASW
jgi:hypothetical protein